MHMASRSSLATLTHGNQHGHRFFHHSARALVVARRVMGDGGRAFASRSRHGLLQPAPQREWTRSFCAAKSEDHGKQESAKKKDDEKESADGGAQQTPESESSRGTTVTLLGMSGFALSLFLRNPLAARVLRVAGPGGMLVGAVLSIYELGGWRLLLSIPVLIVGTSGASHLVDASYEDELKKEVVHDSREGCPEMPLDMIEAVQSAHGRQYETNRIRLYAVCHADQQDAPAWSLECLASRPSSFRPWSVTALRVSRASDNPNAAGDDCPPPQTRYWTPKPSGPSSWQLVWQK